MMSLEASSPAAAMVVDVDADALPRNWVGFGNRTTDDMSRHWLTFYTMTDEEFKAEVAARNALKVKSTSQP